VPNGACRVHDVSSEGSMHQWRCGCGLQALSLHVIECFIADSPCASCVQAYQGQANEGGTFRMSYSLEGDASQLPDMVAAIELEPSVHLVASGCGIPGEAGSRCGDDDWS